MRREKSEYPLATVPGGRSMGCRTSNGSASKPLSVARRSRGAVAGADLTAILDAAVEHCSNAARRKSVSVAQHSSADARISADPLVLFAVVEGLVANAIARSAPGGIVVCAIQAVQGEAVVSIADGGAPLHGADLARMLWPYAEMADTKADGSLRRLDEGWLGVASQLHGSRIVGRNRGDGAGAVISLHLPAGGRS